MYVVLRLSTMPGAPLGHKINLIEPCYFLSLQGKYNMPRMHWIEAAAVYTDARKLRLVDNDRLFTGLEVVASFFVVEHLRHSQSPLACLRNTWLRCDNLGRKNAHGPVQSGSTCKRRRKGVAS